MRLTISVVSLALLAGTALADCAPNCVAGGGPKATDCYLQWGVAGTTLTLPPCEDGNAACDADGKIDGICTFAVEACAGGAATDGCTPASLAGAPSVAPTSTPAGQALSTALGGLGTSGCVAGQLPVPVKVSVKGLKQAVVKLKVTATANGKKDADKLKLTCLPSTIAPSFSTDVQPILTEKCAIAGCHTGTPIPGLSAPTLDAGQAYTNIVGQPVPQFPKKTLVQGGLVKKSYLAAKILGQKIKGLQMPQGCPNGPIPSGGCLDDAQTITILTWIQAGAPNN